jgi:hypothetical protein
MNSFEDIEKAKDKLDELERLMSLYGLKIIKTGDVRRNVGLSPLLSLSLLIDELNKNIRK